LTDEDEKPSILSRWSKGVAPTPRDPDAEQKARELTARVKEEIERALSEPEPTQFVHDPERIAVLVNALKWYLPDAIDSVMRLDERITTLRQLKREVSIENIPYAERRAKTNLLDRKIAGANDVRMAINMAFSFTIRSWDVNREDQELLDRAAAAIIALSSLVRGGIRYAGIQLLQERDGKPVDALRELLVL
jgi:hypothetical protein